MNGPIEKLILLVPSTQALHTRLREMGIPPHAFLRRNISIVHEVRDARGLQGPWAVVDPRVISTMERSEMIATTRHTEVELCEAIARNLAWRMYHEC